MAGFRLFDGVLEKRESAPPHPPAGGDRERKLPSSVASSLLLRHFRRRKEIAGSPPSSVAVGRDSLDLLTPRASSGYGRSAGDGRGWSRAR
ncbi:hypothetical protein NL676_015462 [Syzygium grande]|nr:hypothetical protein NL676_015462 [Syzygium grande]